MNIQSPGRLLSIGAFVFIMKWHEFAAADKKSLLMALNRLQLYSIQPSNIKIIDGEGGWGWIILYLSVIPIL